MGMKNLIATQRSRIPPDDRSVATHRRNSRRNRLALANAGHLGGVLVHGHGVHAPITAPTSMGTVIDGANNEIHDDDD